MGDKNHSVFIHLQPVGPCVPTCITLTAESELQQAKWDHGRTAAPAASAGHKLGPNVYCDMFGISLSHTFNTVHFLKNEQNIGTGRGSEISGQTNTTMEATYRCQNLFWLMVSGDCSYHGREAWWKSSMASGVYHEASQMLSGPDCRIGA